jgi:hypothetical protein
MVLKIINAKRAFRVVRLWLVFRLLRFHIQNGFG